MQIKCLLYSADIKDDTVEPFKVQSFLGSYCKTGEICATMIPPSEVRNHCSNKDFSSKNKVVLFTRSCGL